VVIDTTAPVVTEKLADDTGWSASDDITSNPTLTGSGDANAVVTFSEGGTTLGTTTAGATGAWTFIPTLANGTQTVVASETDAAGNVGTAALTFTLDTASPTVTAVTATPANADLGTGGVATIALALSAAVKVSGTPTLSLNDGGTASYSSGSGTNTLTFKYTVAAGQNTSALAVTGVTVPAGASVADIAGNAADFTGAAGGLGGRVLVDSSQTRTTIASGTGQTVNAGTGNDVVVLSGGTASLLCNGSNDVAFLGGSANPVNATIDDQSSGLTLYVLNGGIDTINGLTTDPTAVIDLLGGVGGYANTTQVLNALTSDLAGGTLLPLGTGQAIDFIGVAPGALHAANFCIG
jgi:hypothetical protein